MHIYVCTPNVCGGFHFRNWYANVEFNILLLHSYQMSASIYIALPVTMYSVIQVSNWSFRCLLKLEREKWIRFFLLLIFHFIICQWCTQFLLHFVCPVVAHTEHYLQNALKRKQHRNWWEKKPCFALKHFKIRKL